MLFVVPAGDTSLQYQVHENEVMRAYKTINDSYIEPISFTVPRRAESFQADIFPPAMGVKPAVSAQEWLEGKTGIPHKIDLESIYEGNAPKEVASDYKPPAQVTPTPAAKPAPKPEEPKEEPKPAVVRSPPPSINDQKGSIAAMANRYQDKEEDEEKEENDDDGSSFEEIGRPTPRSAAPIRSEPKPVSAPAPTPAPAPAPAPVSAPAPAAAPVAAKSPVTTSAPAPRVSAAPASSGSDSATLDEIKQLIENQTKIISLQNEKIGQLASEVESLKRKVGTGTQDQSERIRELELELEELRS
jgi:coronin-1B/1C/6